MSLRWTLYVAPTPKPLVGGSKTQKGHFPAKIALLWKKVCYRVFMCENCQRQSCKAFIGISAMQKMVGGRLPFLRETDPSLQKHRFPTDIRSCSTSAVTPREKSWINTNRKSLWVFHRKSHTGFRLIPTAVTLNSVVESRWLCYFQESRSTCQKFYFLESRSSVKIFYFLESRK